MIEWRYLLMLNYVSHNYLREVRSQVFKFCENMTVLDLSHNKIERISPVAFDETSYATELKLNDNLLTSMSQVGSLAGKFFNNPWLLFKTQKADCDFLLTFPYCDL